MIQAQERSSSAAQGITMAQTVTGISKKKKKSCGILQTSQPCLLSEERALFSLRFGTGFSLILIILQLLLSTSPCTGALAPDAGFAVVWLSLTLCPPANFDLISFDLVTIHSEFTVMLFIPSCSKQMPSAQAITSSCGKFVSLESGDLHAGVF